MLRHLPRIVTAVTLATFAAVALSQPITRLNRRAWVPMRASVLAGSLDQALDHHPVYVVMPDGELLPVWRVERCHDHVELFVPRRQPPPSPSRLREGREERAGRALDHARAAPNPQSAIPNLQ